MSNRSHEKYNRLRPAYSASIACANEATMIKRFNYTNTLLLSARAASGWYDASLTSLFSETKGFFSFSFNKRCPKDAARKTEFFAYVISRKRRANQRKKIQGNVCWLKRSPHAKIETNPKKKKNGPTFDIRRLCIQPFNYCEGLSVKQMIELSTIIPHYCEGQPAKLLI